MQRPATNLTAALVLVAAGCGQQPESFNGPRGAASRGAELPTKAPGHLTRDASRIQSAPPATATSTGLPIAKPAGSALFNAAYLRNGRDWEQVMFLCDGVNGEQVRLVTTPNARGLSQLWTYRKPSFARASEEVRIGENDPGAGQIMRELRRPDGRPIGSIHSFNPTVLGGADVTTLPTLSSITVGSEITPCRWMERGRLLFVDARRTVLITAEPRGGYTYRSYDHAKPGAPMGSTSSIPTATVTGGRLLSSPLRVETYEFNAGPWTYRLTASADNRTPGASLAVLRSGKAVMVSAAVAYEMSAARRD